MNDGKIYGKGGEKTTCHSERSEESHSNSERVRPFAPLRVENLYELKASFIGVQ